MYLNLVKLVTEEGGVYVSNSTKIASDLVAGIQQDRSELFRLEVTKAHIERWGESWFRSGIVAVNDAGKYLCVEEKRAKVKGVYQNVSDIWNLPSGCLQPEESFLDGACREGREETGYHFQLTGICQIIHSVDPLNPYVMVVFSAKAVGLSGDFDHREIGSHLWLSKTELLELHGQGKLRSPDFILGVIDNYEHGLILPLSLLHQK